MAWLVPAPMTTQLQPGAYRLTIDLHNPKGDHRKKHDWSFKKTFAAGTVYYVDSYFGSATGELCIREAGANMPDVVVDSDSRYTTLARYLKPMARKPSDYLRLKDEGGRALAILDELLATKRITWADIEAVYLGKELEYLPNK